MTRREAIKGSLDKWKRICNDAADMSEASRCCALCKEYNCKKDDDDDDEEDCPLCEVGQGCLGWGSNWSKIHIILKNKYGFIPLDTGTLSEQDCCLQLADHCFAMRETLQKLYDAEE